MLPSSALGEHYHNCQLCARVKYKQTIHGSDVMKNFLLGCIFATTCAVLCGFVILNLGLYPINADEEPAWLENELTKMMKNSYINRQIQVLKNPITATPEVLAEGMKSFKTNCAGCHGSPANRDATFANSLFPKAPQFGEEGLVHPAEETFWITKHGIRMSGMPGFGSMLSDDDIWKIAVFLRNVKNLPPHVQSQWLAPN